MQHLLVFRPLELLAVDFVQFDKGKGAIEDVLTMTDGFTEWSQAVPCKDQTAVTIAQKPRDHWFCIYGVPSRLHSDQGRNFEGELIRELCKLYGVHKTRTSPYLPQGNGQTERFNKTLISLIKSVHRSQRRQWPELLPHLVFIYNSTSHSVTGITPYTLMFGREPLIPLDHLLDNLDSDWSEDYVLSQANSMEAAWEAARKNLERVAQRNKGRYDQKARSLPLEVGSRVLLQQTGFRDRHKLADNFHSDPYVVVDLDEEQNLYKVRPVLGGDTRWVNQKMLILDPRTDVPDGDTKGQGLAILQESGSEDSDEMNRGLVFYMIRQHAWHRWMNLVLITMKDCLGDPPGAPGASTIIPFMSQSHVSILEIDICTDRWLPSQGHGLIPPLLRSVNLCK